jgi:hypothetical protein
VLWFQFIGGFQFLSGVRDLFFLKKFFETGGEIQAFFSTFRMSTMTSIRFPWTLLLSPWTDLLNIV